MSVSAMIGNNGFFWAWERKLGKVGHPQFRQEGFKELGLRGAQEALKMFR
jgi:hypothetical protein